MQEQIDKRIREWQEKISAATENLLALDDTLAMKRIEGRDGFSAPNLTGVTAARVLPALAAMRDLFSQIGTLSDVVARAARLRHAANRFWRHAETLSEIERLLTGPSIPLPELKTPLAQRNLTSASTNARAITPEQLLAAMTDAFATARDAVLSVEAAWTRLEPLLDALVSKAERLREQTIALDLPTAPELEMAGQKIDALRLRLISDPLGVSESSEKEILSLLSAARSATEASRREREEMAARLLAARRLLFEITEKEAVVTRSLTACQQRLDAPSPFRGGLGAARIAPLEDWLLSLEEALREKRWQAARVGLGRWEETAQKAFEELAASEKKNQELLALPAEIKGRHAILLARVRGSGGADTTLERLSQQIGTLLEEPRLPIERTIKLMEACEQRLRHGYADKRYPDKRSGSEETR